MQFLLNSPQTDIVAVQRLHYGKIYHFGYQFMVVMSTQLIGFSIGGIAKRFLVSPPSMSMSTLTVSSILRKSDFLQYGLKTSCIALSSTRYIRKSMLGSVIVGVLAERDSFCTHLQERLYGVRPPSLFMHSLRLPLFLDFVPGYLFTALSMFTWVCWIKPNNGTFQSRAT